MAFLRQILADLFQQARTGTAQRTLKNGLTIRVSWDGDLRRILLVRSDIHPSFNEAETVARDAGLPYLPPNMRESVRKGGKPGQWWLLIEEQPESPIELKIQELLRIRQTQDRFAIRNPGILLEKWRALPEAELDQLLQEARASLPVPLPPEDSGSLWDQLPSMDEGPQAALFGNETPQFDPLHVEKGGGKRGRGTRKTARGKR